MARRRVVITPSRTITTAASPTAGTEMTAANSRRKSGPHATPTAAAMATRRVTVTGSALDVASAISPGEPRASSATQLAATEALVPESSPQSPVTGSAPAAVTRTLRSAQSATGATSQRAPTLRSHPEHRPHVEVVVVDSAAEEVAADSVVEVEAEDVAAADEDVVHPEAVVDSGTRSVAATRHLQTRRSHLIRFFA